MTSLVTNSSVCRFLSSYMPRNNAQTVHVYVEKAKNSMMKKKLPAILSNINYQ